ncbi:MAG: translation initiation factor IF-3 [Mycoplasmataceae bacterium]|nr:translation initiation factor IF-3 [Mycoplasmataceae bacterium]
MEYRQINEKITDDKLLVIDENGIKLGIMNKMAAVNLAKERGYDLVLFVPAEKTGNVAIAKIVDYGKFTYEQKMKEKLSRKNQSVIKIKEVKVRPQISDHDLKWRANQAIAWLNDNAQIKFKIQAYGRIGFKPELIQETYDKFVNLLGNTAKILTPIKKLTPVLYESTIVKNK